uniref:Uncharacterized protein n=1 Tax=Rhizophora mucronata TaxID=61149 RepID=A0A2P2JDC2_RHIMU
MKHCVIQESAFSTGEEMTRSATASLSDLRDPVVCPKPRRLGILSAAAATDQHSARSLRLHLSSQQSESDDLDAILMKVTDTFPSIFLIVFFDFLYMDTYFSNTRKSLVCSIFV